MTTKHVRATGKAPGKAWDRIPVNLPPMETKGMPRKLRRRTPADERLDIQAWAAEQPWFDDVFMGRTYCCQRFWIWVLKTSP